MKKLLKKYILIILSMFILAPIIQSAEGDKSHVNLRSYYKQLSVAQAQEMPHISILKKERWGFSGHGTIDHDYHLKAVNGDKVVIDNSTNLMWHQSGSDTYMNWKHAKKWVVQLNEKGYAGFNDWRLPTLEEAVSLLESSKNDGDRYIDPVFDIKQWSIWTCDSHDSRQSLKLDGAWRVSFNNGIVRWDSNSYALYYVRPVR